MPPYCLLHRYLTNIHWQILKQLWTTEQRTDLLMSHLLSPSCTVFIHRMRRQSSHSLTHWGLSLGGWNQGCLYYPLLLRRRPDWLSWGSQREDPLPPHPPPWPPANRQTHTDTWGLLLYSVLLSLCKIFRSVRPLRKSNSALGKSNLFRFYSSVKLLSDRKTESNKTFNSSLFGNILKKKKQSN
jgi:hypothetical protein